MKKADTNCETCYYNYCDDEIGYYECSNSDISDELMEKHYLKGECNCPFWKVNSEVGEDEF